MKKIIIDGVDVAGCEFAVKPINDNRIKCHCAKGLLQLAKMQEQPESIKSGLCENNPKCYYKQLSALKAENDRLKEEIKEVKKYQYEQEYLEKEIETAKVNLNIGKEEAKHYLHEAYKFQKCLQEIKTIAEPFAKCYTHTCRNCEKYDSAHACCLKNINCYEYNDGSKSSCKDFVLPTKQFYQQILANVITRITKAEE